MLLTSQENAVRQWVVDAIADCPALAPIPLERVVWANQPFPDRTYPYAVVGYTGTDPLGIDAPTDVNDLDEQVSRSEADTAISIQILSKASDSAPTRDQVASSYIRELYARARSFVGRGLTAANLAIRDINLSPNLPVLAGKSEWISRAAIDLLLGHALLVTEGPGIIETAEVTGTTTPPTPVRVQIIG